MRKLEDRIVYRDPSWYSTFPCVARARNGDLLVTFRRAPLEPEGHDAAQHVHTRSRGMMVRSSDNGVTWSPEPIELCPDDELAQQDPCIAATSTGRLIANFFRWQAHPESEEAVLPKGGASILKAKGVLWTGGGVGVVTSDDHGETWSPLTRVKLAGACRAHAIEPTPGLLLLPCYQPCSRTSEDDFQAYLISSCDDGDTWAFYATIASSSATPPIQIHAYHEPFVVCTAPGRLVCFMRCYVDNGYMEYCTSDDLGVTWSTPVLSKVWGYPQSAIRLSDGRIFLSYGYRREPRGVRCRVLDPECSNIDEAPELILRDDGINSDLGYTNAIELGDSSVLVVYYFHDADHVRHIASSVVQV